LTGDAASPSTYRITSVIAYPGVWAAIWCNQISSMTITGVSLIMDRPLPDSVTGLVLVNTTAAFGSSRIELVTSSGSQSAFVSTTAGRFGFSKGDTYFLGNGNYVGSILAGVQHATYAGAWYVPSVGEYANMHVQNVNVGQALLCTALSALTFNQEASFNIYSTNVNGPQFTVLENSIINMAGKTPPGSTAGNIGSGGRYIP
jgi:hypothetical protein